MGRDHLRNHLFVRSMVRCAICDAKIVVFANDERSLDILFVCVFNLLRCYAPDLRAIERAQRPDRDSVASGDYREREGVLGHGEKFGKKIGEDLLSSKKG